MTLSIKVATERAVRGAALLDSRYSEWDNATEWRAMIDLEALDLSDCDHCVLAQAYGSYDRGTEVLFGVVCVNTEDEAFIDIVHHGFTVEDTFDFPIQQQGWTAILQESKSLERIIQNMDGWSEVE